MKQEITVVNKNTMYNKNIYVKTDNGNTTYYQIRPTYKGKITIDGEIIKVDKDIVIVK